MLTFHYFINSSRKGHLFCRKSPLATFKLQWCICKTTMPSVEKRQERERKKLPIFFMSQHGAYSGWFVSSLHTILSFFFLFLFSYRGTVCTHNNGTDSFRTLISSVPACALHRNYLTFIKPRLISPQRRDASCTNAHLLPLIRFDTFFSFSQTVPFS